MARMGLEGIQPTAIARKGTRARHIRFRPNDGHALKQHIVSPPLKPSLHPPIQPPGKTPPPPPLAPPRPPTPRLTRETAGPYYYILLPLLPLLNPHNLEMPAPSALPPPSPRPDADPGDGGPEHHVRHLARLRQVEQRPVPPAHGRAAGGGRRGWATPSGPGLCDKANEGMLAGLPRLPAKGEGSHEEQTRVSPAPPRPPPHPTPL